MDTFHFAILQLETFIKIYKIFQRDDEEKVIPSRDSAARSLRLSVIVT